MVNDKWLMINDKWLMINDKWSMMDRAKCCWCEILTFIYALTGNY